MLNEERKKPAKKIDPAFVDVISRVLEKGHLSKALLYVIYRLRS